MDNPNIESISKAYFSIDWKALKKELGTVSQANKQGYQNIFYNAFDLLKIESFNKTYCHENKAIPKNDFTPILTDFRKHFPKEKRASFLKGSYFDDRIEANLKHFEGVLNSPIRLSILNIEFDITEKEKDFRETRIATEEDFQRNSALKIGTEYSASKPSLTFEDHLRQLTEITASNELISVIMAFGRTYGYNPNKRAYKEALKDINQLILEAQQIPLKEAFNKPTNEQPANEQCDYIKLTNGYYQNQYNELVKRGLEPPFFSLFDGNSAYVYAKYVLFKEWLKNQISSPSNKAFLTFCSWLDETGIMKQGEKTKQQFIEGVFDRYKLCQHFNLDKIPERVIKQFNIDKPENKDIEEAKERLIPLLTESDKQKVLRHIEP